MKKILYLLLMFASLAAKAQETYTISGTVNDESGKPITGATAFITNSTRAMPTNAAGKFSFGKLRPGSYEVVVKMLGRTSAIQTVSVHKASVDIEVELQVSPIELNAVNISGGGGAGVNKEKNLDEFLRYFIGQTVNSQRCNLINPDVLHFHFDAEKKILTARADDFLVIENKALGYKIKYLLTQFVLDKQTGLCTFAGSPYFEEMQGSFAQRRIWDDKRRQAYLSSDRHFLRAVMDNRVQQEGFLVYKIINKLIRFNDREKDNFWVRELTEGNKPKSTDSSKYTAIQVTNTNSLFIPADDGFKTLVTKNDVTGKDTADIVGIYIVYTGLSEPHLFSITGAPLKLLNVPISEQQKKRRQISQMQPLVDTISTDNNGELTPARAFKYIGYWAWLRMADLMPLDYEPAPADEQRTVHSLQLEEN